MIPVAATTNTFTNIALANDGAHSPSDSTWGAGPTGSVVSQPAISPGTQLDDPTQHRAWKQLWIENGTDVRLDVGILAVPGKVVNDPTTANGEVKMLLISLAAGATATWDFSPDRLAGPIFLRGTTADPTTGNAYLGGIVE